MEEALSSFPLKEVIGILVCLVASAFFSGSETALTHLSETRARQLLETHPERYGILKFWIEKKKRILSDLLVGNNLVNIFCSVLAYQVATFFLPSYAEAISVFGLTIIILVFSEITPKSIAFHYSEQIAVPILRVVWLVDKLLWVVTTPLTRIPEVIFPKSAEMDGPAITEDEIEYQIRLGHDQAVFEEEAQGDLLMSAVEFSETNVREVMIPRTDIFGLDINTPVAQAVEAVIASGHSRIPVYKGNMDTIIGLLHAKDLLGLSMGDCAPRDNTGLEKLVRKPPMFAPETQKISTLLAKMRQRGLHMAIVVDEFGGTSGLITLEDVIEELVGEIRDEFDSEDASVRRLDSDTWIVDAKISLSDLKDATGIDLPTSGDYESVGGFIVAEHGHIPVVGTVVSSNGILAKVLTSDARKVERLEIKVVPAEVLPENET